MSSLACAGIYKGRVREPLRHRTPVQSRWRISLPYYLGSRIISNLHYILAKVEISMYKFITIYMRSNERILIRQRRMLGHWAAICCMLSASLLSVSSYRYCSHTGTLHGCNRGSSRRSPLDTLRPYMCTQGDSCRLSRIFAAEPMSRPVKQSGKDFC